MSALLSLSTAICQHDLRMSTYNLSRVGALGTFLKQRFTKQAGRIVRQKSSLKRR